MVFKVVIVMNTVATVPSCLMKYLYSGVIDLCGQCTISKLLRRSRITRALVQCPRSSSDDHHP